MTRLGVLAGTALAISLGAWTLWAGAALAMGGVGPDGASWLRVALGAAALLTVIAAGWWRGPKVGAALLATACLATTVWFFAGLPASHDRSWSEDQSRLPGVRFDGDLVHITDARAFRYRGSGDWDARWFDTTYDLSTLEGADFAVERFTDNEAVAHTLVSFRFTDGRVLAVSVEIRKEIGESYGPVRGMFRQYELMVVLGDERDLLELRAVHREDTVYMHPMRGSPETARAFLERLLRKARDIRERPQWYHTVSASCTSVLAQQLQAVVDLPLDHRIYLPGYSDSLAFELGIIDTTEDFPTTRERNRINERAVAAAGQEDFSERIRKGRTDQTRR